MTQWGCRCSQVDSGDEFSAIFSIGAAACGGGSSSTGYCGGGSDDGCRWRQPVSQWTLQVDSSSERFQWSCRWCSERFFSEFNMVQLRVTMAAAAQDTAEGAVVTAAGGEADGL